MSLSNKHHVWPLTYAKTYKTWTFNFILEFFDISAFLSKFEHIFRDCQNFIKTWTFCFISLNADKASGISKSKYFVSWEAPRSIRMHENAKTWTFVAIRWNFSNPYFGDIHKIMGPDFVEYSTGQIEISTGTVKIFEFSRMCRYVLHLQPFENMHYWLKSRSISHFKKSTARFPGCNSSLIGKYPVENPIWK